MRACAFNRHHRYLAFDRNDAFKERSQNHQRSGREITGQAALFAIFFVTPVGVQRRDTFVP
jgi:hypothetical protein